MNKIGLIAGNGRLPILFAQAARKKGFQVVCVAIEEDTDKAIAEHVDNIYWVKLGELSKLFSILIQQKITKAAMVGQIKKVHIFEEGLARDKEVMNVLSSVSDNRDSPLLSALIDRLGSQGIEIIDSTQFLDDLLPQAGVLTKRNPTASEKMDVEFGFPIAREIAGLDIGQTIIVKNRVVVSVEAVEGTDEAIKRAAGLAGEGLVVIKVARPKQDMRFDIPVIGLNTIQRLIEAKSNILAIEAKKTLLVDRDELIKYADDNNISIIAL